MPIVCNFPLLTILAGMLGSVICTLLKGKGARTLTLCIEAGVLGMSIAVLIHTLQTGEAFTYVLGEFPAPWGNELRAGVLESLMAVVFAGVLSCSVCGGMQYTVIDVDETKQNLFYTLVNLLTAALMALVWTNDLFTGYVFLEIMTLSSCGLIAVREQGRTSLAAVRYMIMNLLGSGLFLLSVVLMYALTGHLLMVPMHAEVEAIVAGGGRVPVTFALTIMTIGLGIKSGLFPSYFWMPDTYGNATPAGSAILSSLVSKGYIFLLIKVFCRIAGDATYRLLPLRWVLFTLGILGIIGGSVSALRSKSINRMTAYSSAAQIGYIYLGLGIGGTAGYTAALLQIIVHALTKSLLFITTPRLATVSGESLLFFRLRGSGRRDPFAGFCFTAAAMSMVGIPFLAGFSVKLFFATAAVEYGNVWVMTAILITLGISSVLNATYFLRTVMTLYRTPKAGTPETEENPGKPAPLLSGRPVYYGASLMLILGNLYLGLSAPKIIELIQSGLAMFA